MSALDIDFVKLDRRLFREVQMGYLTFAEWGVLCLLQLLAIHTSGIAFCNSASIATPFGLDRKHVAESLKSLRKKGYISYFSERCRRPYPIFLHEFEIDVHGKRWVTKRQAEMTETGTEDWWRNPNKIKEICDLGNNWPDSRLTVGATERGTEIRTDDGTGINNRNEQEKRKRKYSSSDNMPDPRDGLVY